MSMNIPQSFTRDAFQKLTNKTLGNKPQDNNPFQQYKKIITDNYKKDRTSGNYVLKEGLSREVIANIDFIFKRIGYKKFSSIREIAKYFKRLLEEKKYIVLFAYNGTGKTRLSGEFKSLGQQLNEETGEKTADTLYYNAFTEDLFYWDNDLDKDTERVLKFNKSSRFFSGLKDLDMDNRMQRIYNIKVSRGEENIFIWCFFLAIVQLVIDKAEAYEWVKYIYVDDPISSLDDNNVIAVASHLAALMKVEGVKVIVSSHHTLFFNVLCNGINRAEQLFLQKSTKNSTYILKDTTKTPFFHHVALLKELKKASDTGILYTYHFNILRNISFHGYAHFSSCIRKGDAENEPVYIRIVNLLSHGNYSLFDPKEMVEENKEYFRNILNNFLEDYNFNQKLFEETQNQEEE